MRLFIGIDFEELTGYFHSIQNLIKSSITATYPKSFHCTIKFLGDFDDDKVELIKNKLMEIKFESFRAALSDIGFFPNKQYVRIVFVGIEPEEKFIEIKNKVDVALSSFKFKKDKFKPHITIARVRDIDGTFFEQINKIKVDKKEIKITKFKLMKSELTPNGAAYETLAEFLGVSK